MDEPDAPVEGTSDSATTVRRGSGAPRALARAGNHGQRRWIELALVAACVVLPLGVPPFVAPSRAQTPAAMFELVHHSLDMRLHSERLVWSGTSRVKRRFVVKTPEGLANGQFTLRKNSLIDIRSVDVRIQRNGKWRDVELESFETVPWAGHAAFDDDVHVNYMVPDLRVEDRVEIKYERKFKKIWEIPEHYFGGPFPVEREVLEIRVPRSLEMAIHESPGKLGGPAPERTHEMDGDKQLLRWELVGFPGLGQGLSHMPPVSDLVPSVRVAAASARVNGQTALPVRRSWADFARWYEGRVEPILELDRDLRHYLEVARRGAPTQEVLVERIYRMVQTRVRYVAHEVGEGGWLPRSPSTTYASQYGDCKDMSSLLVALLREADIPAHLALVSSRRSGRRVYTEFPYSLQFDHCVAYVPTSTGELWLDATGPGPMNDVPSFISAQPALVLDGAETRFVQAQHPDQPTSAVDRSFRIESSEPNAARLHFRIEWRGPAGYDFRLFRQMSDEDEVMEFASRQLSRHFRRIEDLRIDGSAVAQRAVLEGRCRVEAPFSSSTQDGTLRLRAAPLELPQVARSRSVPYRLESPLEDRVETTIVLPWEVRDDSLSVHFAEPFASFALDARTRGRTVSANRVLRWERELIEVDEFAALREFVRAVARANDKRWLLKRH